MADQRRELEMSRAARLHDQREWAERERRYLNQLEELERKLKAAKDELAEARQDIIALNHQVRLSERRTP